MKSHLLSACNVPGTALNVGFVNTKNETVPAFYEFAF